MLWLGPLLAGFAVASTDPPPPLVAKAEAARERGDCVAASRLYAQAAESLADIAVARRASDLANACGVPEAQWRATKRWRTLDPENIESLRALGLIDLSQHRLAEAREVFGTLFAKPDVEIDRALEDLLPEIGEQDSEQAAWAVFRVVVDRGRISAATRVALARLAGTAFDYAGARAELTPVLAKQPDSAPAQRLAARLAAANGRGDEALKYASRAAELDPKDNGFARAETLSDLDRVAAAAAELERLRQADATRDEAQRRLALLALSQGDYTDARRRFSELLRRGGPAAVEAFFYMGTIAELTGDKSAALATYERLVDAGGGMLPRSRAASILLERGERAAGLKLIDDYARSNPHEALTIAIARAGLLADAKLFDDAIEVLNAMLAQHPGDAKLLYERGMLFERAGRTAESLRDFETLLVARPDDPNVLNSLGYTLVDHKRDLPRAERLIRRAVELMPDNAALVDSLGWALFRRGDNRSALPLLERAWNLSYADEIAAHWGEVLWVSGARARARTVWARALVRDSRAGAVRATMRRLGATSAVPALPSALPAPAAPPAAKPSAPGLPPTTTL